MTKIIFSFDDARLDSFDAIRFAGEHNINSTLNVTTGYVDGSVDESLAPCKLPPMTKEQVVELSLCSFVEIACHSDSHTNEYEDIVLGKNKLLSWLNKTENEIVGFASPSSKIDFEKNPIDKFHKDNFAYVRVGPFKKNSNKFIKKILRKLARVLKLKWLLFVTYKKTLENTVENKSIVHGVPILNDYTFEQVKYIIDKCVKKDLNCVLIFHSVLGRTQPFFKDRWSWDFEKYEKLCLYVQELVNEGNISSLTTRELV